MSKYFLLYINFIKKKSFLFLLHIIFQNFIKSEKNNEKKLFQQSPRTM